MRTPTKPKVIIHCKMCTLDVQEAVDSPYRVKRNQHLRLGEGFLCVFAVDSMMSFEDAIHCNRGTFKGFGATRSTPTKSFKSI